MSWRLFLFIVAILISNGIMHVEADFFYNHVSPKVEELEAFDLKCVPGRTVMRIKDKEFPEDQGSGENDDDYVATDIRRSHMNFPPKDDYCQICVCSVEGKDEYCSRRPAMNVNECIRMATLLDKFHKNVPFEHERSLAFRIRRDYLWHNDEIPYEPKAKCRRGHSYYSNSVNANDTDIDVASDVESLLDYSEKDICYYCVCSMDGRSVGCISRSSYFCEYYRNLRENEAARDMYATLFEQDRPTYFRQLSYRLRRTMDSGIFDLMENGGDALCCDHPNGHRRSLHNHIRSKIRQLRRKVPKENLLSGAPVGSGQGDTKKCIPFVSEYTDCTDENQCSGCSKCTCNAQGEWSCETVDKCSSMMQRAPLSDNDIDSALLMLENEMKRDRQKAAVSSKNPLVPSPPTAKDFIIVPDRNEQKFSIEDELIDLMRPKRSTDEFTSSGQNGTVQFHHTIDEINEDTLKRVNFSGTIQAKKLDVINQEKLSRRTGALPNKNSSNSLQIEYNKPKLYEHMTDNKLDTTVQTEDKFYGSLHQLSGNHTQQQKNKDLSMLIVNELKGGVEVVGDKNAPIMSNITFTPENDTLTAMTFVAGNLLNKLWNMERDSSESIETELLKHEKIADLLELFKEPLTMRQESFLKNALKQLSTAIDKSKDIRKVSLCDTVEKVKRLSKYNCTDNAEQNAVKEHTTSASQQYKDKSVKAEAVTKMISVIDLIKRLENVKKHVNDLKQEPEKKFDTENLDANTTDKSLNLFGGILDKITKLIQPDKKSKSMINNIKSQNIYSNVNGFEKILKEIFNINIGNLTVNAKDKLILDYLQHIDSNPDCLLNRKTDKLVRKAKLSTVEGNILLNLSEYFKIKSLGELFQLTSSPTKTMPVEVPNIRTLATSEKNIETPITQKTTVENLKNRTKTWSNTKEKLKTHLKSILEDVMEMQLAKGLPQGKGTIEITDILPCIYKILNENEETKSKKAEKPKPVEKVAAIFENLKKDLKYTQNTRRTNYIYERPKSATVWDRIIKNLNDKYKLSTRRSFKSPNVPKDYEELKKVMDDTESGSNTYKTVALLHDIPPADRLTLLKTFDIDVKKYTDALGHIKASLDNSKIPINKFNEIAEYIDNTKNNINLNKKVVDNLSKYKPSLVDNMNSNKRKLLKNNVKPKQSIRGIGEGVSTYGTSIKITREQIVNQLIKNRLRLFLRIKEASQTGISEDISYDIAKKILLYLERGNYVIARELYKVFLSKYEENKIKDKTIRYPTIHQNDKVRRVSMREKEPLIQFEETKVDDVPLMNHNQLLKQLINIKNMKI